MRVGHKELSLVLKENWERRLVLLGSSACANLLHLLIHSLLFPREPSENRSSLFYPQCYAHGSSCEAKADLTMPGGP